eukprot:3654162-Pyramimonas_sp.AAC.1
MMNATSDIGCGPVFTIHPPRLPRASATPASTAGPAGATLVRPAVRSQLRCREELQRVTSGWTSTTASASRAASRHTTSWSSRASAARTAT